MDAAESEYEATRGGCFVLAYDAESGRVILFGGETIQALYDDTWAYDFNTNAWTIMNPATRPAVQDYSGMAYDAGSDRVILFGGAGGSETWAYDFNTNVWTNMNPVEHPSGRWLHRMAYDEGSDRVVLFGGENETGPLGGERWAYDFNTNSWTNMEPPTQPLKLAAHNLAYDAESDRIVLFGGDDSDSFIHSDETWAYDLNANTWTDLIPVQESQ